MASFNRVEEIKATPGEYLMKIYSCEEKTSQSGNDYFLIKFESAEEIKICDSFMFTGKMANKTLQLFKAIGLIEEGQTWEEIGDIDADDLLGRYLYVDAVKDKENPMFLKTKFEGFRKYEKSTTTPDNKQNNSELIGEDEIPF